jgi:hypothetical protein
MATSPIEGAGAIAVVDPGPSEREDRQLLSLSTRTSDLGRMISNETSMLEQERERAVLGLHPASLIRPSPPDTPDPLDRPPRRLHRERREPYTLARPRVWPLAARTSGGEPPSIREDAREGAKRAG